jgi:hypothetical protein
MSSSTSRRRRYQRTQVVITVGSNWQLGNSFGRHDLISATVPNPKLRHFPFGASDWNQIVQRATRSGGTNSLKLLRTRLGRRWRSAELRPLLRMPEISSVRRSRANESSARSVAEHAGHQSKNSVSSPKGTTFYARSRQSRPRSNWLWLRHCALRKSCVSRARSASVPGYPHRVPPVCPSD